MGLSFILSMHSTARRVKREAKTSLTNTESTPCIKLLVEDPPPVPIPSQDLHPFAGLARKQEHLLGKGIELHLCNDDLGQLLGPAPHVHALGTYVILVVFKIKEHSGPPMKKAAEQAA